MDTLTPEETILLKALFKLAEEKNLYGSEEELFTKLAHNNKQ